MLLALLPQAPEWNPIGALFATGVETEIFGRTVAGLRRTGLPMNGEPRWDEVYVDRNQGTLRIQQVGPVSLALPKDFTEVKKNDEASESRWANGLGRSISVIRLLPLDSLTETLGGFIAGVEQSQNEPVLGEAPPEVSYSFIALVDERTCPGNALHLEDSPTFMVVVTQGKFNFLVMAKSSAMEEAKTLLVEALTAAKLDSPVFHPAW